MVRHQANIYEYSGRKCIFSNVIYYYLFIDSLLNLFLLGTASEFGPLSILDMYNNVIQVNLLSMQHKENVNSYLKPILIRITTKNILYLR